MVQGASGSCRRNRFKLSICLALVLEPSEPESEWEDGPQGWMVMLDERGSISKASGLLVMVFGWLSLGIAGLDGRLQVVGVWVWGSGGRR